MVSFPGSASVCSLCFLDILKIDVFPFRTPVALPKCLKGLQSRAATLLLFFLNLFYFFMVNRRSDTIPLQRMGGSLVLLFHRDYGYCTKRDRRDKKVFTDPETDGRRSSRYSLCKLRALLIMFCNLISRLKFISRPDRGGQSWRLHMLRARFWLTGWILPRMAVPTELLCCSGLRWSEHQD